MCIGALLRLLLLTDTHQYQLVMVVVVLFTSLRCSFTGELLLTVAKEYEQFSVLLAQINASLADFIGDKSVCFGPLMFMVPSVFRSLGLGSSS